MKKLISRMIALGVLMLSFYQTGCGDGILGEGSLLAKAEDAELKIEVEKLVKQHFKQQEDLIGMYDIEECSDFTIGPKIKGTRKGSVNLCLKNKKTGEVKKLAYEFTYENDSISAGVKDPAQALELMGLGGLADLARQAGFDEDNKADKVLGLDQKSLSEAAKDIEAAGKMMEKFKNLTLDNMEYTEKVTKVVQRKLEAEWFPQLQTKARKMGIKQFSVEFDDDDGVLLLPDDQAGRFSGMMSGTAKADGDETEFSFRLEAKVVNGNVTYEIKR